MPVPTQAKLLRVLEDHKLRRLGSKVEHARWMCGCWRPRNKIPEEAVAKGELRNDLYYRLNEFNRHTPPLREHKEDVPQLVKSLLADMNEKKHGRNIGIVSEAVLQTISERVGGRATFANCATSLERGVMRLRGGDHLNLRHMPPGFGQVSARPVVQEANTPCPGHGVGTTVEEAERLLILKDAGDEQNRTRPAPRKFWVSASRHCTIS